MTTPSSVDVQIEGSMLTGVFQFQLLTERARDWVDENTGAESWQFLGGALCIADTRLAMDLASGMQDDGLIVE